MEKSAEISVDSPSVHVAHDIGPKTKINVTTK